MSTQDSPYKSVAFSGYRASKILNSNYCDASTIKSTTIKNTEIIKSIEEELHLTIESLYNRGYRKFITGGSSGFDTLAAMAVLRAKSYLTDISLNLALPFVGHNIGHNPGHSAQDIAQYQEILNRADNITYTSQEFHKGAFLVRNNYMLLNSSVLVCYYDGQRGGTMYTVNRALKIGHEIINICKGYQIKKNDTQLQLF